MWKGIIAFLLQSFLYNVKSEDSLISVNIVTSVKSVNSGSGKLLSDFMALVSDQWPMVSLVKHCVVFH